MSSTHERRVGVIALAAVAAILVVFRVFAVGRAALLEMLGYLGGEESGRRRQCAQGGVRDVAVQLLHDDLRRLSRTRDR